MPYSAGTIQSFLTYPQTYTFTQDAVASGGTKWHGRLVGGRVGDVRRTGQIPGLSGPRAGRFREKEKAERWWS